MDPAGVFKILQTGGPVGMAAVFCWMWWLERKDRQAAQEHLLELATASVEATTRTGGSLDSLAKMIESRRRD